MKVTVLGCSGSVPGPDSPASGYLIEADGYRLVLDMGHGSFGALQRYVDPTAVDAIIITDAETGEPLAMMDSASVTALRTGAATAVAAKHLARADSRAATVVGCGAQGEIQLAAIAAVLPLEHAWVLDTDQARAEGLAARARADLGLRVAALPIVDSRNRDAVCNGNIFLPEASEDALPAEVFAPGLRLASTVNN